MAVRKEYWGTLPEVGVVYRYYISGEGSTEAVVTNLGAILLSLQTPDRKTQELHAATTKFDYTGGFRQELIELSDVLPASVFDTVNID